MGALTWEKRTRRLLQSGPEKWHAITSRSLMQDHQDLVSLGYYQRSKSRIVRVQWRMWTWEGRYLK